MKNDNLKLGKKLAAYSSIGAAFLAANPQVADAAIVYTDVPDPVFSFNIGAAVPPINFAIDFDGQNIHSTSATFPASGLDILFVVGGSASNWVAGGSTFGGNGNVVRNTAVTFPLTTLGPGYSIGPLANFSSYGPVNAFSLSGSPLLAPWTPSGVTGFIGVRFNIGADTHYGWIRARLEFDVPGPPGNEVRFTVLDFAYEDTPNTAIAVGAGAAAVPTLSEWGLITLSLFLMSFGTIFVARREGALGMAGGTADMGGLSWVFRRPPFFVAAFKKALLATGVLTALLGLFSMVVYGGITAVDFFGAMVAAPVFAYLMHLMMVYEKEAKRMNNGEW